MFSTKVLWDNKLIIWEVRLINSLYCCQRSFFRFLLLLFITFATTYCAPSTPAPTIRVVLINLNEITPTPATENTKLPIALTDSVETPTLLAVTSVVATETPTILIVAADTPIASGCNCNGNPVGVTVELYVNGGIPPYTLAGYNKSFNDSYTVPIDKNIRSLTLTVFSNDGQKADIIIEIPSCVPPLSCGSNGGGDPSTNSTILVPTNPKPTDPPPTKAPPTLTSIPPGRPHGCNDGQDNDHDGYVDTQDPQCRNPSDDDEGQ